MFELKPDFEQVLDRPLGQVAHRRADPRAPQYNTSRNEIERNLQCM